MYSSAIEHIRRHSSCADSVSTIATAATAAAAAFEEASWKATQLVGLSVHVSCCLWTSINAVSNPWLDLCFAVLRYTTRLPRSAYLMGCVSVCLWRRYIAAKLLNGSGSSWFLLWILPQRTCVLHIRWWPDRPRERETFAIAGGGDYLDLENFRLADLFTVLNLFCFSATAVAIQVIAERCYAD